jgi:hypothetical protein
VPALGPPGAAGTAVAKVHTGVGGWVPTHLGRAAPGAARHMGLHRATAPVWFGAHVDYLVLFLFLAVYGGRGLKPLGTPTAEIQIWCNNISWGAGS